MGDPDDGGLFDVLRQPQVIGAPSLGDNPDPRLVHIRDGLDAGISRDQVCGLNVAVGGAEVDCLGPLRLVGDVPDVPVVDVIGQRPGAGVGDHLDGDAQLGGDEAGDGWAYPLHLPTDLIFAGDKQEVAEVDAGSEDPSGGELGPDQGHVRHHTL